MRQIIIPQNWKKIAFKQILKEKFLEILGLIYYWSQCIFMISEAWEKDRYYVESIILSVKQAKKKVSNNLD